MGSVQPGALARSFGILSANAVPVMHDWPSFLGKPRAVVDWSRVGEVPTQEETQRLMSLTPGCLCSFDPACACPVHPCRCRNCKKPDRSCIWRDSHQQLIQRKLVSDSVSYDDVIAYMSSKLTYVRVVKSLPRALAGQTLNAIFPLSRCGEIWYYIVQALAFPLLNSLPTKRIFSSPSRMALTQRVDRNLCFSSIALCRSHTS